MADADRAIAALLTTRDQHLTTIPSLGPVLATTILAGVVMVPTGVRGWMRVNGHHALVPLDVGHVMARGDMYSAVAWRRPASIALWQPDPLLPVVRR